MAPLSGIFEDGCTESFLSHGELLESPSSNHLKPAEPEVTLQIYLLPAP
jgi:hypothetical protein